MEEKNLPNLNSRDNRSKWAVVILLFLFIPPLGLYYIWKERQFFSEKFHLALWFSGGWILTLSFIILTMWLPGAKRGFEDMGIEKGLSIISYFDIILPFIILFSILQIIFGFAFDRKISSSPTFPKEYITAAMIFLFITLAVAPIAIVLMSISANMSLYQSLNSGIY